MSGGNYSITTRATGTILTASIYNSDHQNHVDNNSPQGVGGYSDNVAQMQVQTSPGGLASETLAGSIAGELERLRFVLSRLVGKNFWYEAPNIDLNSIIPTFAGKNKIINGDMRVDQRNSGNAITPTSSAFTVDRWGAGIPQASKLTFQQVSSFVGGFKSSLKASVASQYSPIAGDTFTLYQGIEGFDCEDLKWGTSDAETVTLSFWFESDIVGTYCVTLRNKDANRNYVATFVYASANTPQFMTIIIPGDTTGTWFLDNSVGIYILFDLGSGASSVESNPNQWTTSQTLRTSSAIILVDQVVTSHINITGIQLEKGNRATRFEYIPYAQQLATCMRFFERWNTAVHSAVGAGHSASTSQIWISSQFEVRKRVVPTLTASGTVSDFVILFGGGSGASNAYPVVLTHLSQDSVVLAGSVGSGLTGGGELYLASTAVMDWSAEL